jgi:threonine dehydrogenase-like Zn-dependent dehydrogenase
MNGMKAQMMKALVYEGPRMMNVREVPVPAAGVGEVMIRVEIAGICGSELNGYLGHNALRKPPLVMGHEFAGTVIVAGEGANKFESGNRVTANPLVSCGSCQACQSGTANLCPERYLIGAGRPGAFAEYVVVPEKNVYALPDSLSFIDGALVEPFACAVRVCHLASAHPKDRMLIMGAGPIGLFVLETSKIYGMTDVVVMDINEERLAIVKELGGIGVLSTEELTAAAPAGGFEKVVDAVGLDITRQQCIQYAKPGGSVVFSGLHVPDSIIPINLAIRNEIKMFGSFGYTPNEFEMALNWLAEGKANLKPWLSLKLLENGQDCFEKLLNNPGKLAKIMLDISKLKGA